MDEWESLDGIKKIKLLKHANIPIYDEPIFGKKYNISYPKDIYQNKEIKIDPTILKRIRNLTNQKNEIGGTITYNDNNIKINLEVIGEKDRIIFKDHDLFNGSLFHTHPKDDYLKYDPPSILDIVSFLAVTIKNISTLSKNQIYNSIVFTKDEIYVYYISKPLLDNIINKISNLDISSIEKLMEEIEICYCSYLYYFNKKINSLQDLSKYLSELSKIGILIKRYTYTDQVIL